MTDDLTTVVDCHCVLSRSRSEPGYDEIVQVVHLAFGVKEGMHTCVAVRMRLAYHMATIVDPPAPAVLSAERSELVHDPVGIEEGPVVDDAEQSRSRNLPQAIDPRAPPYNAKVDKSADGIDGGVAKPLTGKQELPCPVQHR